MRKDYIIKNLKRMSNKERRVYADYSKDLLAFFEWNDEKEIPSLYEYEERFGGISAEHYYYNHEYFGYRYENYKINLLSTQNYNSFLIVDVRIFSEQNEKLEKLAKHFKDFIEQKLEYDYTYEESYNHYINLQYYHILSYLLNYQCNKNLTISFEAVERRNYAKIKDIKNIKLTYKFEKILNEFSKKFKKYLLDVKIDYINEILSEYKK